jgi:hypothetical protein
VSSLRGVVHIASRRTAVLRFLDTARIPGRDTCLQGRAGGLRIAVMRRAGLRLLATLVLVAAFACPILEMFDHWDHTAKTGKDTESALVIVALCAGTAMLLVQAVGALRCNCRRANRSEASCAPLPSGLPHRVDQPPESPPLVPLRV